MKEYIDEKVTEADGMKLALAVIEESDSFVLFGAKEESGTVRMSVTFYRVTDEAQREWKREIIAALNGMIPE